MTSTWDYVVTHYSEKNSFAAQDITDAVNELPMFTDSVGTQVKTARILINANRGHFIRDARGGETGFPTNKIDHRDRIRIVSLDGSGVGGQAYDEVFDVVKKVPTKSNERGTELQLDLIHIGRWLQKINYIKPHFFTTPDVVWEDIGNYYNDNRGTQAPTLTGFLVTDSTNNLTKQGTHHFDYGINEEFCLDRFGEVADIQGSPGTSGGVLDFFDFRVNSNAASVTTMEIDVFSSGSPSSGSEVTIDTSLDGTVNSGDTDGGIEEEVATVIHAWGANGEGTLPTNYSRFKSRQILLPTDKGKDSQFPNHVVALQYLNGGIVAATDGLVYQANKTTTATPPDGAVDWIQLTPANYYGDTIQYSTWTDDKRLFYKNSGADPTGLEGHFTGGAQFDINIVINDDTTFRTWVDMRATTDTVGTTHGTNIKTEYLYPSNTLYSGLRVLVRGTGTDGFAGFTNKIIEYDGTAWRVKYEAGDDIKNSFQCAVLDEARLWMWDNDGLGGGSGVWNDITSKDNGSDCFHYYADILSGDSIHIDASTGLEFTGNNNDSAVKSKFSWSPINAWSDNFFNSRVSKDYYECGAWLCLRIPFPISTFAIGEDVGEIYGGSNANEKVPQIDAQNMHLTHDGLRGFNNGLSSEDYGQLAAIDFFTFSFTFSYPSPIN